MYKACVIAFLFLFSCDVNTLLKQPPKSEPNEEIKVEKVIPKTQSFREGMEIFCASSNVKAPDNISLSDYLEKELTNPEVLAGYKSMKLMTTSSKKKRLEQLLDRATLAKCEYQDFLIAELEKEHHEEEAKKPLPFEEVYVGDHHLRVNRVNHSMTKGKATIVREGDDLLLNASVRKGKHRLVLKGKVFPKSEKQFILEGQMTGIPDITWKPDSGRERTTKGRFLFKATKGRKFWRMYRVNGRGCVCDDGCGNDFCYIDLRPVPTD